MVRIEYLSESRLVRLSSEVNDKGWGQIRRACVEASDEFVDEGPLQFVLPWWSFLLTRQSIRYLASQYNLELSVDKEASQLLSRALNKAKEYHEEGKELYSSSEIKSELAARGFVREITSEQERNIYKLIKFPSAATFSVPGAGKTTEALAYFTLHQTTPTYLIVVSPKNAFAAWEEQVKNCLPSLSSDISRLTGGASNIRGLLAKPKRVLLITYQQIPTAIDLIGSFINQHSTMLFLDESHRMKRGTTGVIGKAILSLAHLPVNKLIMSGTPLPNSIQDLIPQFNFLYPEVKADEYTVKDQIQRVFVRTTKSELKLPRLDRILTPINLTDSQRYLYTLMRSEAAREAAQLKTTDRIALRRFSRSVLRLIQLVSNPMLLAKHPIAHEGILGQILSEEDSPKIEYVCNRARELAFLGRKTVIWSTFVENVELIAARLSDLRAEFIHGGVEAGSEEEEDTREAKIRRFHDDPHTYVLVANPAACSEGISLHTVCHHAIYIDRNFNAAQFLQSEDRIHRFGLSQDQLTTVEIIYSPDTIDEIVDSRLRAKVKKMSEVLDDPDLNIDPVQLDPDNTELENEDVSEVIQYLVTENK